MIKTTFLKWICLAVVVIYGLVFGTLASTIGDLHKPDVNTSVVLCKSKILNFDLSKWLFWGGFLMYLTIILLLSLFWFHIHYKNIGKLLNSPCSIFIITFQLLWWVLGIVIITNVTNCKETDSILWNTSVVFLLFQFIGIIMVILVWIKNFFFFDRNSDYQQQNF